VRETDFHSRGTPACESREKPGTALREVDVAVPPKGDSYTHRHEQSERLVVAPPARIDCYDEGPGGGRTETVTQAEVNRFTR